MENFNKRTLNHFNFLKKLVKKLGENNIFYSIFFTIFLLIIYLILLFFLKIIPVQYIILAKEKIMEKIITTGANIF